MQTVDSFRAVIELWPSHSDMARETGLLRSNIFKWWQRDRIPSEWWQIVLSASTAKQAGLTAERLTELAAREPAEARQ